MRIGQVVFIDFISTLTASVLGFVATIYVARVIGPEPLGIYHVVVSLVSTAAIIGDVGIAGAVSKRVSEGTDQFEYAAAGVSIISVLFFVVIPIVVLFRSQIANYVNYPAVGYILIILLLVLINGILSSILIGLNLVHISGILSPIRVGAKTLSQIGLIIAGMGTAALFFGHILGLLIAVVVALYYAYKNLQSSSRPSRYHFVRIVDFARYAWLGRLQGHVFSYTDVLVLGFFVSPDLIGVYIVAWNIGQLLITFSGSLITSLFPKISSTSAQNDEQAVTKLVEQALGFGGMFLIPGLFGGMLLSERILRVYGPEFQQGKRVLVVLIIANLIMGYQNQLTRTLGAINRPDLSFKINLIFVITNVSLNLFLILLYGWIGAAIATTISVLLSFILAYYYIRSIFDLNLPIYLIMKQFLSAIVMFVIIYLLLVIENTYMIIGSNLIVVISLVLIGSVIYFTVLLKTSYKFRNTIKKNIPFDTPIIEYLF